MTLKAKTNGSTGAQARLVATLLAVALLLLPAPAIAAGGAYAVDDAGVDAPGACKVESWAAFSDKGDFIGTVAPACVVPFITPLDIGVAAARAKFDGSWGTAGTVKAKANILPIAPGRLGLGVSGALAFDLVTGETAGTLVNVPATFEVNDALRFHVNAGWLYEQPTGLNWLLWGAAVEWKPAAAPVTLIAEVFGQAGHDVVPASVTSPRFQAGLRVTPVDTVDVDLIYGRNLAGEDANWITIGLNLRFEAGSPRR